MVQTSLFGFRFASRLRFLTMTHLFLPDLQPLQGPSLFLPGEPFNAPCADTILFVPDAGEKWEDSEHEWVRLRRCPFHGI